MVEELGKIEKPEANRFLGKKKLYLVPLLFSWKDSPPDYVEKYNLYWQQVREHLNSLESRIGSVKIIYHESVTEPGDNGIEILEKLNPASHQLVREKCLMGARLEVAEDRETIEESMDWERHMMIGFLSSKVAALISQFYQEASRKRYDHILQRVKDTLQDGEVAMLVIREGHNIQFPSDIEVFSISPPALNEIRRWLRERQDKMEIEPETVESETEDKLSGNPGVIENSDS
jgi:hypothetical protein